MLAWFHPDKFEENLWFCLDQKAQILTFCIRPPHLLSRVLGDATEEEDDLDEELVDISSSKEDNSDWSCESSSGLSLSGTLTYSFINSCLFAQACLILARDPVLFTYNPHSSFILSSLNPLFSLIQFWLLCLVVLLHFLPCLSHLITLFFVLATTWMDAFLTALSLEFLLRHLRSSLISLEKLWKALKSCLGAPCRILIYLFWFRKWTGLICSLPLNSALNET